MNIFCILKIKKSWDEGLDNNDIFFPDALGLQRKKFNTIVTCETVLSACLTAATDWDTPRPKKKNIPQGVTGVKTLADHVAEEASFDAGNVWSFFITFEVNFSLELILLHVLP